MSPPIQSNSASSDDSPLYRTTAQINVNNMQNSIISQNNSTYHSMSDHNLMNKVNESIISQDIMVDVKKGP